MNTAGGNRGVLATTILMMTLVLAGCGAGAAAPTGGTGGELAISATAADTASALSMMRPTQATSSVGTVQSSSPALAPPSPLHPAGTLTNADNGSTVHYKVGDTIDVALNAASGFQNWQVAPPDPAILRPTINPAAAAVRGATLRAFQAVGAGTTSITASSEPTCSAGQACPQLVQGYRVTVVIGR